MIRLINIETLKLETFSDGRIPKYAILSHTWGPDAEELTFQDVQSGKTSKPGIGSIKLEGCCAQAKEEKDNIKYVWIDTCCIDKSSSAELQEAINAMYKWYMNASICYAYMWDVPADDKPPSESESKFFTSRWFTRGWTLQELLAPKELQFFNADWKPIGNKAILSRTISKITGIPPLILKGFQKLDTASVAQRMSWAAHRETTRPEDLAYCLLGVFGINMPMLYSEGGKAAFFRLQDLVMKKTGDDSILAWDFSPEPNESRDIQDGTFGGEIFAVGPSCFANSGDIVQRKGRNLDSANVLGGSLPIHMQLYTALTGETFGLLNCGPQNDADTVVGIPLAKASSGASNEYIRPKGWFSTPCSALMYGDLPELIHIKKEGQKVVANNRQYWLYEEEFFSKFNLELKEVQPLSCWDKNTNVISVVDADDVETSRILLRIRYSDPESTEESPDFLIILDLGPKDTGSDPLFHTAICGRNAPLPHIAKHFFPELPNSSGYTSNGVFNLHVTLDSDMTFIPEEAPDSAICSTIDASSKTKKRETAPSLPIRKRHDDDIDARDHQQRTPLHLAALEDDRSAARRLLKSSRVNVNARDDDDRTPLHLAAAEGSESVAKLLLENKEVVFNAADDNGRTPLHVAALEGYESMVRLLLEKDEVDVNARDDDERTPLHLAASEGNGDVVRLLLKNDDIDVNAKDDGERTPLHLAILSRQTSIVKMLLRNSKVDANARGDNERTPLHLAASEGPESVAQLLIEDDDVDLNARDGDKRTPLHLAIMSEQTSIAKLLIDEDRKGLSSEDHRGATPLHQAAALGLTKTVKLLLSTGRVDVNARDAKGTTPLHFASRRGHTRVVELLLDADDIDLDPKDVGGKTPLQWASERDWSDTRQLLLDRGASNIYQRTLRGHEDKVAAVAFSHDSDLIASGSWDSTVKIWDWKLGKCQKTLQGHKDKVNAVSFSHNSKLIASGSDDSVIRIWNTKTGHCQKKLGNRAGKSVEAVAFSHDSETLICGGSDATFRVWDVSSGSCLHSYKNHKDTIFAVAFSPDSELMLSASNDGVAIIWNTVKDRHRTVETGHDILSAAFSGNADSVYTASSDGYIREWDTGSGEYIGRLRGHSAEVSSLAVSSDSPTFVASGSLDETLRIWDDNTGKCRQTLKANGAQIWAVAISHDSDFVACGLADNSIEIWDMWLATYANEKRDHGSKR